MDMKLSHEEIEEMLKDQPFKDPLYYDYFNIIRQLLDENKLMLEALINIDKLEDHNCDIGPDIAHKAINKVKGVV